ncbi:MAG: hypothetical protein H7039_13490 [Bryobacteraceae bacterium]|nr:hypothetical protein [Bryobacteraceae bacterium]
MDAAAVANGIIWLIGIYVAAGLLFAAAFLTIAIGKVDPVARRSGVPFRLIILPGTVALWPVLLAKWITCGNLPHAGEEK